MFANRQGLDLKIKCQFVVNDIKSGDFIVELADKDKHPDNKWHSVDIQEHGFEPLEVSEGTPIHIMMKICDPSMKESFWGKGTPETYCQIEGQDYVFDTAASSYDQAGSRALPTETKDSSLSFCTQK